MQLLLMQPLLLQRDVKLASVELYLYANAYASAECR
jgi:hypothetical protein